MGCLAGFLGAALILFGIGFYLVGINYGVPGFFNFVTIFAIILGLFEFYLVKVIQDNQKWGKIAVIVTPIVYLIIIFGENLLK